ncbi:hypothetical protein ABMA27_016879 [Loxostege sticticalis]|uniref:Major facilitator superfamily (MFS) profile domain-containing protein n=1 Tax=Loxostege sticticalis TaxID=481309 RepID=A0ABR3I3X6_LOXSC
MRACMGVALVAMVQYDSGHVFKVNESIVNITVGRNLTEGATSDEFETNGFFNALLLTPPYVQFHWTKKVQDTVMSGFFWGYMILQIPGGQLAYRFGARYLLFGALMINCVISLMFPVASYYGGWILALICRICQGLSQACMLPSFHSVLSKWSPLEERGRMSAIVFGGQALGTVLGLPVTGFLAATPLGWPGIFRFYGVLSGTIAIFIWFFLADSPAQHKWISVAERRYIEEALEHKKDKKLPSVPWKSILTSGGMIAIVVAHIGNTWGQVILYSEVPAYMDKVMGVNIKANGLLTALPFMMMFFANFFFSWLTDMLIVKKYLNVVQSRKLFNTIGCVPAAIGFALLAFAPKNIYVIESILIVTCCFKVAASFGFLVNHIDISPNFAGVMMSISNFSANLVGSFAPIITGLILTDVTDEYLWRKVFFIAAGFYFFTNVVYIMFGSGKLADWNNPMQYESVALNEKILIQVENVNNKNTVQDVEENERDFSEVKENGRSNDVQTD